MHHLIRLGTALLCAAFLAAPSAFAVTADEEAARIEKLAAMEPEQTGETAVQPLMEIEKTWEIEDTHALSSAPLVTSLSFCRGEMGEDMESRTFYAPIGTGLSEWPKLAMTACGADEMRVAWVDDYAWDDPGEAVRSGTAYQLIAWTESAYEYLYVVFTGLPVMSIRTFESAAPSTDYSPAYIALADGEADAVSSVAQIHIRGGGVRAEDDQKAEASGDSESDEKISYRIEFQKKKDKKAGYKKNRIGLLGMPEDSDWILLSNTVDLTHVHNYMAFRLWTDFNADASAFNTLQSRMVELCLNGKYMGVYQLIQRVKPERELEEAGFAKTDVAARLISKFSIEERPVFRFDTKVLELRYQPEGKTADECFSLYGDYVKLMDPATDDETFASLAAERLDVRQIMRFFVFHQSVVLDTDNILNNVYIWAVKKDGGLKYLFSPWDMDRSLTVSNLKDYLINEKMTIPIRMLDLNLPGAREALWAEWALQRSGPLSDDALGDSMAAVESEMNATGAWIRDALRWNTENGNLELGETRDALILHLSDLEEEMQRRWPLN